MSVTDEDTRIQRFAGNGSTLAFAWDNQLRGVNELIIYEYIVATGVEALQVIDTDYTIALASDFSSATINFNSGNAPATGTNVVAIYGTPLTNENSFKNHDGFPGTIIDESYDRGATQDLTLKAILDRVVLATPGVDFDGTIPNMFGKDGYAIVINDDGDDTFSLTLENVASNTVSGPASSTDNAAVRFDGTGGKTLQDSGVIIDDSDNISGVGTIASGAITSSAGLVGTTLDIGGGVVATDILDEDAMGSDSATALSSQQSIKAYVDAQILLNDTLQEVYDNDTSVPQFTPTTGGAVPITIHSAAASDDTSIILQVTDDADASTFSVAGDGDVVSAKSIIAGTGLTVTTGNITVSEGNILIDKATSSSVSMSSTGKSIDVTALATGAHRIQTNAVGDTLALRSDAAVLNLTLSGAAASELAAFVNNVTAGGTIVATGNVTGANLSGTNTGDEISATSSAEGTVELATSAEVTTGTDTVRAVTPEAITQSNLTVQQLDVAAGFFILPDPFLAQLSILTGAVTATQSQHTVDTESDDATDDLDTINGGVNGAMLILRAQSGSRTVVCKDGTGNLLLEGDFSLDSNQDKITLIYDGALSKWTELSRSNNAA